MVDESSPHNVCGQILFSLKMSRLNYMVKETPFSAYVTIKKKFVHSAEAIPEPLFVKPDELKKSDQEINSLKEKNKDLERRVALAIIEVEQIESKCEALENKNRNLDDKYEEMFSENSKLTKENDILKFDLAEASNKKDAISTKFENHKRNESKKYIEKCDMVDILENTLANKNSEIERIKL